MRIEDALAIWRAGVAAVNTEQLIARHVRVVDNRLAIVDRDWSLDDIDRIVVVGAGKAGAGMAAGFEQAIGPEVARSKQLTGWLNVPADCVRPLEFLHLHAARPAGLNEPAQAGVVGAERILNLVGGLGPRDLCVCLLSGGGSALLPAPIPGVSLADKQQVTRQLSAAGANIRQLNTVRKQLSRIKGGGLARACRAGSLVTLIISDVLGDPLDIIASGPTVPDPSTPEDALRVLRELLGDSAPAAIVSALRDKCRQPRSEEAAGDSAGESASDAAGDAAARVHSTCQVIQHVIGNNAVAVEAAAREAVRRGYRVTAESAEQLEGAAEDVARQLVDRFQSECRGERGLSEASSEAAGVCLISGGEPVVRLAAAERRGKGGRNQQLVLAALQALRDRGLATSGEWPRGLVLLSGGTDGEDGPTDAAGGWIDARIDQAARHQQLDLSDFLARNDAYAFLQATGGLLKTGPTHTNVCDLRVLVWNHGG